MNSLKPAFGWAVLVVSTFLLGLAAAHGSQGRYMETDEFLQAAFGQDKPAVGVVWLTDSLRPTIEDMLGHRFALLRVRYWHREGRTAWILDEVGKDEPITIGVAIENQKIQLMRVLVFREIRGWEVRYPFFTDQFTNAGLDNHNKIDQRIDGITGATLSVRAMRGIAHVALYLDEQVQAE